MTPVPEMVERVARALYATRSYGDRDEGWADHVEAALAAIEAMREPTEAMVAALNNAVRRGVRTEGSEAHGFYGVYEPDDDAGPCRAMMAAALFPDSPPDQNLKTA